MKAVRRPSPRRIVVFRALKLGDLLCAVPALRALRAANPRAEIVLVGLPWACEFVDRYRHLLDGFREFPGYPGLSEREPEWSRIPTFFEDIRAARFDLAIELHGSGAISIEAVSRFGAGVQAGFYEAGRSRSDPSTYLHYPGDGLEVRRLLRLIEHLGIESKGEALEFHVSEADRVAARRLLKPIRARASVCVHECASVPERRWHPECFAAAANALASRGLAIVLTGSAAESDLAVRIAESTRFKALDLTGTTTLGTLAALIDGASLLLCNGTSVSHLADALGTASVVISTGDNPARWAPANGRLHRVLRQDSGVSVARVVAEAEDVLALRISAYVATCRPRRAEERRA